MLNLSAVFSKVFAAYLSAAFDTVALGICYAHLYSTVDLAVMWESNIIIRFPQKKNPRTVP